MVTKPTGAVETIRLTEADLRPRRVVWAMRKKHPDGRHYNLVVGDRDLNIEKPDGSLLLSYRVTVPELEGLSPAVRRLSVAALVRAANRGTNHRHLARGDNDVYRNYTVGFLNGEPTGFTRDDRAGWLRVQPVVRAVARAYERERPAEYAKLKAATAPVPRLTIPGTAFTSVTVSRDPSGLHPDDGNLAGGCCGMTAVRLGEYTGALLVFPRYRVAVDLGPWCLLVCDNTEYHGNTKLVGDPDGRLSVVCYVNESNLRPV